jgi:hypothetical protein
MKYLQMIILVFLSSFIYSQDTLPKQKCNFKYLLDGVGTVGFKRSTLNNVEFLIRGTDRVKKEDVRITFQDIDNSFRELIIQESLSYNQEYTFVIPSKLLTNTSLVYLQVMRGNGSFYLKIDIRD